MSPRLLPCAAALSLLLGCAQQETGFQDKPESAQGQDGAGTAEIAPNPLVFVNLEFSTSVGCSSEIIVGNTGDGDLIVYSVGIADNGEVFYAEELDGDKTIAPGDEKGFPIIATLSTFAPAVGSVRVQTSDGANANAYVDLEAYPVTWEDTGGATPTGHDCALR